MNKTLKKTLSIILTILMIVTSVPFAFAEGSQGDIIILYTNDVHCAIDDYPALAAYRAELISQGNTVITVDAGNAIHGEVVGALTEGEAIVDLMNAVGYDYAVPGEGEFEYGIEDFFSLAENKAEFKYISTNFHYLPEVRPALDPFCIEEVDGRKIAFIGISTPESVVKLPDDCFKDENNNYIYGFPKYLGGMTNEDLYDNIQESVDYAIADGADIVVAVGHLGIEGVTEGWKSTDVIAGTTGIDYFIDAHSHEVIESEAYTNKDGKDVILTSGGEKLEYFGQITLKADGSVDFNLVNPDTVNIESLTQSAKSEYSKVKALVDNYHVEVEAYYKEVGDAVAELENVIFALEEKLAAITVSEEVKADYEAIKADLAALKADYTATKEDVGKVIEAANVITGVVENCINGTHTLEEGDFFCYVCGEILCDEIKFGDTYTVTENEYVKFVPAASGTFIIRSVSDVDPKVTLYDADFTVLAEVDDSEYRDENGCDFYLEYDYTAGETYYFEFYDYNEEYNYAVILEREHVDNDGDYICDNGCGHEFEKPAEPDTPDEPEQPDEPTDSDCDHLCHKTGFMGFIWKIVRVILKLFRMNPVCECGMAHY